MKVEVAVLGSPSLMVLMVSVDEKRNLLKDIQIIILFASVYVSTFQLGNFVGWGSGRVNEHRAKGWPKSRRRPTQHTYMHADR